MNKSPISFGVKRQQILYDRMKQERYIRHPLSYEMWRGEAKANLASDIFDYIEGGAGSEETVKANRQAFNKWRIRPKMLKDISKRDMSLTLFGETIPAPVLLAPIGIQAMIHPDGEVASARAAGNAGIPFIASTVSSKSMEEIARVESSAPKWFQLYWNKDYAITKSFVNRAEKAGYSAIVITLDAALTPWKERDLYNAHLPFIKGEGIQNYLTDPIFCQKLQKEPIEDIEAAIEHWKGVFGNPGITWKDIDVIRQETTLPILLKGVLHPDDALMAIEHGIDGIIVSNHGGRQIDGSITALDALPEITAVINKRIPVLMDSGIRRGSDVLKALALGAEAVLLGRPYVYGLAADGEEGVNQVIQNILSDFDITMGLAGIDSISNISRSLLVKDDWYNR